MAHGQRDVLFRMCMKMDKEGVAQRLNKLIEISMLKQDWENHHVESCHGFSNTSANHEMGSSYKHPTENWLCQEKTSLAVQVHIHTPLSASNW